MFTTYLVSVLYFQAANWKTLPTQHICQTNIMVPNAPISDSVGIPTRVSVKTDGCDGTLNSVRYLEHVQCKISLRYNNKF